MNEIKYSITIQDDTEGKKKAIASGGGEQTTTTPGIALDKKKADKASNDGSLTSALVAVKTVEPYIQQAANFAVSQISFQNGSAELQQRAQVFAGLASSAVTIGISAMINPVAAAATAGMQILQKSISFYSNWVNIQNAKTLEQETLAIRRSRAGMLAGRSRGTS